MENLIRERISINMDVMDMLNQQIHAEQLASSTYLAMASWCDQNGFINATKYFYAQSEEEREHMMKLFTFVNDNGGAAISPQVLEELPNDIKAELDQRKEPYLKEDTGTREQEAESTVY